MSIQNADAANAALDQIADERDLADERQEDYAATKAKLEAKRDQHRQMIEVTGEPVEFRPVGGGVALRAMKLRQQAAKGSDSAELDLVELVFETLAKYSVDDSLDEAFWRGYQMDVIQDVFQELVLNDMDIDEEEIEQFRSV